MKHIKNVLNGSVVALLFAFYLATGYASQVLPVASQLDTNQNGGNIHIDSSVPDEKSYKQVNWMGHWLHEDLRETLVREIAKEFEFENDDIILNLKFPQEIMGVRSKPLVAKHIAETDRLIQHSFSILKYSCGCFQFFSGFFLFLRLFINLNF